MCHWLHRHGFGPSCRDCLFSFFACAETWYKTTIQNEQGLKPEKTANGFEKTYQHFARPALCNDSPVTVSDLEQCVLEAVEKHDRLTKHAEKFEAYFFPGNVLLVPVPWPKNPTDLVSTDSMQLLIYQHQNTHRQRSNFLSDRGNVTVEMFGISSLACTRVSKL